MQMQLSSSNEAATYHLLTQTVLPRPIAWALTADAETQRYNLAPFSFFAPLASEPPLLAFSIGNRLGGRVKDTAENAAIGAPIVIHIPSSEQSSSVQASAAPFLPHESELDAPDIAADLDETWDFPLPRIASAPVAFGCFVSQRVELAEPAGSQILVIARASVVWVRDDAVHKDGRGRVRIDPSVIDPLARLGSGRFSTIVPA